MDSGDACEQTSERFENGIMAGDLDSLLEMFERAETSVTSSSAAAADSDGRFLMCDDISFDLEGNRSMVPSPQLSSVAVENLPENGKNLDFRDLKMPNRRNCSVIDEQIGDERSDSSFQNTEISFGTFAGNLEKDFTGSRSFEKRETFLSSSVASDAKSKTIVSKPDVGTNLSASTDVDISKKDDSGSSSEWDEDFPPDEKGSESSSGADTPCRIRGSTVRRDGPRRQQGRGRVKPFEEEQLYDRLPSYYTVFSRPNATGRVRSTRSCLQLVLKSDQQTRDRDPSPNSSSQSQIFDKVPAYQSCFTNSTRYDEETENQFNCETDFDLDAASPYGRGIGSGSTYVHGRPRFRSRSRLRTVTGPRNKRSGRPLMSTIDASVATSPDSSSKPDNSTQEQHRRVLYIGRIPVNFTADRLKATFEIFGKIEKCTAHFRECGDNYGFVTYANTEDAYHASEGGNQLHGCENFDICFGDRRNFCKADYFDLDGNVEMEEELGPVISKQKPKQNFDDLLMDEMLKRKLN